jgi:diguanylate cyclase (GGDEF)-like protein/PAS domain S-box-containing protein
MRTRFPFAAILVLIGVGLTPAAGLLALTVQAKHQEAEAAVDGRLAESAHTAEFQLSNDLQRFQQILLTSAQNPAYTAVVENPQERDRWTPQLNAALLQLTSTFAGMIDEACRIDPNGVELGRVVQGRLAPEDELSADESTDNPAFAPTMELPSGAVHFEQPYISPDTNRWVIAAATPLYAADGHNTGILHFEVPLAYYQRVLRGALPADGFLAIADPEGHVYLSTRDAEPSEEPMPAVRDVLAGLQLDDGQADLLSADSGSGLWTPTGESDGYRIRFQRLEAAPGLPLIVVVGLPAAPGYVGQLQAYVVPVAIGSALLVLVAIALAMLVARPFRAAPTRSSAAASVVDVGRGGWIVLSVVLGIALAAACAAAAVHRNADSRRQDQAVLARLEGQVRQMQALVDHGNDDQSDPSELGEQIDGLQTQMTATVEAVHATDFVASVSQAVVPALAQYTAEVDEWQRLVGDGRGAEAGLWYRQRVLARNHQLLDVLTDEQALSGQAADRAELAADVGAGLVMVLAALLMSYLIRRTELARRQAEASAAERFRSLVRNASDVIAILELDGRPRYHSPAAQRVWGYPPEVLAALNLHEFTHGEDRAAASELLAKAASQPGTNVSAELRLQCADDTCRVFEVVATNLMDDPGVSGILATFRDITDRKALEIELGHRAFHDVLTELPNRALLVERLQHALARGARTERHTGVLFVDLDDFKIVNDSLGHRLGDQLLVAVAQRLRACVRPGDTAARLGGDEFILLLEDLTGEQDATIVAERFLEHLQAPFVLGGQEVFVGASVGVAVSPSTGKLADDLLREADVAMYVAKMKGKRAYVVFDPDMEARPRERLALETDLRRALERDEFRLHYQPIVELESGRIGGVEALLRWEHPERGLVPPADFIPLAEATGLIVPIGSWVLHEACRQMHVWQMQNPSASDLVMSVNLAARQFLDPGLVEDVAAALRASGLEPSCLKLEITESAAMEAGIGTIQTLQALKGLGTQLAIDDFGTGYSSLSYLKRFPVDTLKIDRSFVDGLGDDPQDTAIVQSVIGLARTLSLSVTAEGIETVQQLRELQALRCEEGQGYYFSRPQPATMLNSLFARFQDREGGARPAA